MQVTRIGKSLQIMMAEPSWRTPLTSRVLLQFVYLYSSRIQSVIHESCTAVLSRTVYTHISYFRAVFTALSYICSGVYNS
ncbi:hypothetical protein GDO78_017937 [Eleutherodactylus coqui]|uniref:Uncharacterized protein n=1 Tax=Eleutherodactylus coqui TaxID=57060 RepID=A0A8J6ENZ8_ELECQ|nr:hypothetical protein GDO78_017937 [Eleutherodactylus coqui]